MAKAKVEKTPAPVSEEKTVEPTHNETFEKAVMDEIKKLKEENVQLRADLQAVEFSSSKNKGVLESLKLTVSKEKERLQTLHIRSHMAYEG